AAPAAAAASAPVNITPARAPESAEATTEAIQATAAAARPAQPAAVATHDPATDPVLPATAEPLVLPVTLRGGTPRPDGSAASTAGLGFSFIEPSQPGRPTTLGHPQAAGGILVLEIEKPAQRVEQRVEAPVDAPAGVPAAAAVAAAPVSIPATN
ncbi:MAG: hypothetical protein WAS73_04610, partial [Defluviicoccus sp.]